MNTLEDTLNTLPPSPQELARHVIEFSSEEMSGTGKIKPVLFAEKPDGKRASFDVSAWMSDESKQVLWEGVRAARRSCPVVGLITEVWLSECKDRKWDGVMPRDRADRKEAALFNLWQGRRVVTLIADILRDPSRLGEWRVLFDSDFPGKGKDKAEAVTGDMMEGQPYAGEGN